MENRKYPKGKYAWSVKVGERGQIVIPKEARQLFHIEPGDELILLGDEERGIAIPKQDELKEMFSQVLSSTFGDEKGNEK